MPEIVRTMNIADALKQFPSMWPFIFDVYWPKMNRLDGEILITGLKYLGVRLTGQS